MSQVLQDHARELLGHSEVQELLDRFSQSTPKVIEDIIPINCSSRCRCKGHVESVTGKYPDTGYQDYH